MLCIFSPAVVPVVQAAGTHYAHLSNPERERGRHSVITHKVSESNKTTQSVNLQECTV